MRTFLLFVLPVIGPWFILPPLPAMLLSICAGLAATTWHSMRHTFPKRIDPDVLSSDPAETERRHEDKVGAVWSAMRRHIG